MSTIDHLLDDALTRLARHDLQPAHLEAIRAAAARLPALRQRLLYLQSTSPFIGAGLIAAAIHEPVVGGCDQLNPLREEPPYQCVHDAIVDGWQVIHFPDQRQIMLEPVSPEIGVMGYEFILQKLELVHDDQ
jgi:hypothetical protein